MTSLNQDVLSRENYYKTCQYIIDKPAFMEPSIYKKSEVEIDMNLDEELELELKVLELKQESS